LRAFSSRTGLNGDDLARTSRLTARVDNNAIAHGFQFYLHSFVVSTSGKWAVVQQGMNSASHLARRYHWHSAVVRDFTSNPHTAIVGRGWHGAPSRFSDPARFSFAHGGKDGHPFPVPLKTYDESISVLRRALEAARLGHTEKLEGFRRLDRLTRSVEEQNEPLADYASAASRERAISASLGWPHGL
jgi:hypothetical protein